MEEHGLLMPILDQDKFLRAQTELNPKESLRPYQGRWVALRDGKVIASDLSLAALRSQPEVKGTDVVMPVSRHQGRYFIA
jgi:hypothetical protein